ncbi:AAA family ATPase [Methanospirillum stamsii]|uniref:Nitrogenase iron protein n=1 Tax=Methanospirillum stamsii TaxID=1277351 RepID=A0A2V2N372_9EURY|nr:nitrogenase iron protein NifH [Methanospirillum stamsii]PWR69673.1 nitrogenase iron protein [Methanospirillum stamsii]
MRRIALYGKGGIGKSTTTSNLSIVLAKKGYTVMQIGCDPKADSTRMLTGGERITPILKTLRQGKDGVTLDQLVTKGDYGIYCAECGGPTPGVGCAGRGIISAFERLDALNAFNELKPDFVLYDVLGDVVCGGFAMPLRKGYAEEVYIVTSGELMSLYAAENIALAVSQFSQKGYARLCGIIQNSRNVENEDKLISDLAAEIGVRVVTRIPRDKVVQECESARSTVASFFDDGAYVRAITVLADEIISKKENR